MARHSVVARHKRSERAIEVRPTLSVRKGGWQSGGILHEPRRIRRSALQAQISSPAVSYLSEPVSALLHVHTKLPQIDLAVTVHVELRVAEGTAKQVRDGGPR